jgi:hypothetical protein
MKDSLRRTVTSAKASAHSGRFGAHRRKTRHEATYGIAAQLAKASPARILSRLDESEPSKKLAFARQRSRQQNVPIVAGLARTGKHFSHCAIGRGGKYSCRHEADILAVYWKWPTSANCLLMQR